MKKLIIINLFFFGLINCYTVNDAIKDRNFDRARQLVNNGADVNAKEEDGWTPLHIVCRTPNFQLAKFLIEKGANVNAKEGLYGATPLHLALLGGDLEIAKLLLEKGANVTAKDNRGKTPVFNAISSIKVHTDRQSYVDDQGYRNTSWTTTTYKKNIEWVQLLLNHGAGINEKDNDGKTPLHHALEEENFEIAKFIIEKGANINAKDKKGKTPLMTYSFKPNIEKVKFLIKSGADVNEKDNDGLTALHLVHDDYGYSGYNDVIPVLIAGGADINARDREGFTPLHYAILTNKWSYVDLLISKGANINARDIYGFTTLDYLPKGDRKQAYLISKGAIKGEKKVIPEPSSQKSEPTNSKSWSMYLGEMDYLSASEVCSSRGMRLPTIEELKAAHDAEITEWFLNQYWSSTRHFLWNEVKTLWTLSSSSIWYASLVSTNSVRCIN